MCCNSLRHAFQRTVPTLIGVPVTMLYCHRAEQDGETALMMAAEEGHFECVSVLLANGADVNFATLKVMDSKCCAILQRKLITFDFDAKNGETALSAL